MQKAQTDETTNFGKHSLRQWLQDTASRMLSTAATPKRKILLPSLAIALMLSSTLLACGPDSNSQPASTNSSTSNSKAEAPTVKSANSNLTREMPEQSTSATPELVTDLETPEPPPASSPTAEKPTIKPMATATTVPTQTPTATPVPTPTRNPHDDLVEILTADPLAQRESHQLAYKIAKDNRELMIDALVQPAVDFIKAEHRDETGFYTESQLALLVRHSMQEYPVTLVKLPSTSPELHIRVQATFRSLDPNHPIEYQITATGVVNAVKPSADDRRTKLYVGELSLLPVFSHYIDEPIIEKK